jgi:hypothetical protein
METVQRTRYQSALKLLLSVVIATCVLTVAAKAQPTFVGTFTLPYEVHWGQALLPAGEYFIRMDSAGAAAKVTSTDGSRTVYTQFPTFADSEKGDTHLTITKMGNERRVRSLNAPKFGKLIIFAPLSKSEREELAKAGQSITVPVVTAKK